MASPLPPHISIASLVNPAALVAPVAPRPLLPHATVSRSPIPLLPLRSIPIPTPSPPLPPPVLANAPWLPCLQGVRHLPPPWSCLLSRCRRPTDHHAADPQCLTKSRPTKWGRRSIFLLLRGVCWGTAALRCCHHQRRPFLRCVTGPLGPPWDPWPCLPIYAPPPPFPPLPRMSISPVLPGSRSLPLGSMYQYP